jgi:hypothetical protein
VTTPRTPRPEPGGPRPRTIDEQLRTESGGRTTRRLAIAALVLAVVGVGVAAVSALAPVDDSCQTRAWNTAPKDTDLPAGWTVASSQYDIARKSMSLLGPPSADETTAQPVVYATITCYPSGAGDSVTRSEAASKAANQDVISRNDLGDQGFSATDASGATFLQFRHDRIVVYLAGSLESAPEDVDAIASAFDKSLGGDGGAVSLGTPGAATPAPSVDASDDTGIGSATAGPSDDASASAPVAPELEAALPAKIGDIVLTIDSASGSMILGTDQGSRAITAALRANGKTPDDLKVAQAYDETATTDLSIMAIGVDGLSAAKVVPIVLDSWLAASGAGVTREPVTLAGHAFTRVDYGDEGPMHYVGENGDAVIWITTTDPAEAEAVAAALP